MDNCATSAAPACVCGADPDGLGTRSGRGGGDRQAERRELLLLLHADFALFHDGGAPLETRPGDESGND